MGIHKSFSSDANVFAIGDFDGDGKPDMVVANNTSVGVMRNISKIGRVNFETKTSVTAANIANIALADLDGDGKLDMAGISSSDKKVVTFRNTTGNGAISFEVTQMETATEPGSIAIGDINGDGKPDLALTLYANSAAGHKVSAILNESEVGSISYGTSLEIFTAESPGTQVYITDMDRNGRPDLSVVNFYEHTMSIMSYKPSLSVNADLSALAISSGELYFIPASADTVYSTILDAITTSMNVTAAGSHEKQTLMIRVNDSDYAPMTSGVASSVPLLPGTNKIEISVLAENGVTTKTYNIYVFAPFAAPGRALRFSGTDEYVEMRNSTDSPNFTLEAWIRTSVNSPSGTLAYQGAILFGADQSGEANDFVMSVLNNKIAFHDGNAALTTIGKTVVTDDRWHHVALVREENVAVRIYVDGILDQTGGAGTGQLKAVAVMSLGGISGYPAASFNGSMDEVRVWKTARTGAEIAQHYLSIIDRTTDNLQTYYNFDIGTQEKSPIMMNMKGGMNEQGYFQNLDPSGSNWIESYAMVVPTAKNATGLSSKGFTANWSAPSISTATSYFLDVATNATFTSESMLPGYSNLEVSGTSKAVTIPGMESGRQMADLTYYYRVRAEKSSEIGQGTNSLTITVCQ